MPIAFALNVSYDKEPTLKNFQGASWLTKWVASIWGEFIVHVTLSSPSLNLVLKLHVGRTSC